ncbi:unnamed protein product, partial [Ixodes pacificus]
MHYNSIQRECRITATSIKRRVCSTGATVAAPSATQSHIFVSWLGAPRGFCSRVSIWSQLIWTPATPPRRRGLCNDATVGGSPACPKRQTRSGSADAAKHQTRPSWCRCMLASHSLRDTLAAMLMQARRCCVDPVATTSRGKPFSSRWCWLCKQKLSRTNPSPHDSASFV